MIGNNDRKQKINNARDTRKNFLDNGIAFPELMTYSYIAFPDCMNRRCATLSTKANQLVQLIRGNDRIGAWASVQSIT
ncbi:hypothetical protein BGS_0933 [Beggiatoa sp. SS]|nr:hypothetical protein BGS_0933 [Beggiatoa sp. SS]